jgi:hypothetical protein
MMISISFSAASNGLFILHPFLDPPAKVDDVFHRARSISILPAKAPSPAKSICMVSMLQTQVIAINNTPEARVHGWTMSAATRSIPVSAQSAVAHALPAPSATLPQPCPESSGD